MLYRVLVYLGNLHDELDRETIIYSFSDPNKMVIYLTNAESTAKSKGMYFSYIIEELKLEENLVEKEEKDLT